MGRWALRRNAVMFAASFILASPAAIAPMVPALAADPVAVDQGEAWTPAKRDAFYSLDQGSRVIPLRWIMALKLPDGTPFMADSLRRYGYLPNEASPAKLPVGFTSAGQPGKEFLGMTCAACHTRQIEFGGVAYRIDGGPAIVDFQALLHDLDIAVGTVVNDGAAFADFARAVLGSAHTPADATDLRQMLGDWYYRYHILMEGSLPQNPWGPGRLDAIAMIINRLTGLDLGPAPSHVIEGNIKTADAPARYPFLWNAAKQDFTQWQGFAHNQNAVYALLRNIGQVLGVFAEFHPKKDPTTNLGVNYLANNSTNIPGLKRLEVLMRDIGAPRWPWALDEQLAEKGKQVYDDHCNRCHSNDPGPTPWTTLIDDVNTDSRQLELTRRLAETGELEDAIVPGATNADGLEEVDAALIILKASITGIYLQSKTAPSEDPDFTDLLRIKIRGYEARVLHGVWAAAPYLHNGSVPTLAELLKPAAERTAAFKIGSAYDPVAVGLAVEQTQFNATMTTTDCSDRSSGNSRCGHEFGTDLDESKKRALLEYLKKL